jgi:hypothetical protein
MIRLLTSTFGKSIYAIRFIFTLVFMIMVFSITFLFLVVKVFRCILSFEDVKIPESCPARGKGGK